MLTRRAHMDALAQQQALIDGVARSLRAAADRVERFDTHASTVLVADGHAFKFKKALKLPFLDFSTLAARRRYCREECRLNRRLAPALYIDAVPVAGDVANPILGGAGEPLDYAVWMHAFDQGALWSERLARGLLGGADVDGLAALLAPFHRDAARAPAARAWGSAATVTATCAATLAELSADAADDPAATAALAVVREWEARRRPALGALVAARKAAGMVRECHGDLHCNNILTNDGEVQAFDCIEFDDALRWIDVIDDVAFPCMDVACRGRPDLAARLLNAYLERTGDYAGLSVLPHYRVHRALVRAKVMLLRARQGALSDAGPDAAREACRAKARSYLGFAHRCTAAAPAAVIAMHGFSGSGKTTVGRLLVELLGAVQLRSDVERKRLQPAAVRASLYGADTTRRTYARLCELARTVAGAGWPVVVDAACLMAAERACLRAVAAGLGVPFLIVDVRAPPEIMRARIAARRQAGRDASDADAAVLERQLAGAEPLSRRERACTVVVDTGAGFDRERLRCAVAGALQGAHVDAGHMPTHDGS